MMTDKPRISRVAFTPSVLVVSTPFSFTSAIVSGIQCCGDRLFGRGEYVILEHGVLASPLEQLVNSCVCGEGGGGGGDGATTVNQRIGY